MSNQFIINTSTNAFLASQNPFLGQDNKSQQSQQVQINSTINNKLFSLSSNINQDQKTPEIKNNIFSGANNNLLSTNSQTTNVKKDDNNPFGSFLSLNQPKIKENIFTNQGNINKEENKSNSIINTNTSTNINLNTSNNILQNNNTNNVTTNNTNTNNITTTNFFSAKNTNGITGNIGNKDEKKEETNNIFLAKSNSFLNKSNKESNINNDKENGNKEHFIINQKSLSNELSQNNNEAQNQNNGQKKEDEKADVFLNNLLAEDKLIGSNKKIREYIKNQTLNKFGEEIINEMKSTLDSQKKAYHECVKNTRELEERFYQLGKIGKEEADFALQNQIRYEKLLKEINNLYQNTNSIEQKVSLKNKNFTKIFDYMNQINKDNNNNISYINRINFEDKNQFYKNLMENSKKLRKFEEELNIINSNFERNEQDMFERDEFYEKYSNNNNELFSFNNDMQGVWIERNNTKIYVEQKEMDEIYNDCYNGLCGLIDQDEEIMRKIDTFQKKIIEIINKNNKSNGLGNYEKTLNMNNNININNYNIGFGSHS